MRPTLSVRPPEHRITPSLPFVSKVAGCGARFPLLNARSAFCVRSVAPPRAVAP